MANFDIFISYKHHGKNNEILPDYYMAQELYTELTKLGLCVFFCNYTKTEYPEDDYMELIDAGLECAKMLIVVATEASHCKAKWVKYEWRSFQKNILSSSKEGKLISYLDAEDISKFPFSIRTSQFFNMP